LVEEEKTNWI